MAGITMNLTLTTAAHSLEHSMSAYHHGLPHGAGLIIISKAFYEFFIERHACDEQFIKMARAMGVPNADEPQDFITALMNLQKACGVENLKLSDYGFEKREAMTIAKGARSMQGILFTSNPCEMTDEDCAAVLEKSYQ
jgi:alcohol dehydrogenase class IV